MPQTSHWCNGVIRKHVRIRLDCKKIIIEFQFTIANKSWSTVYKSIILMCWRLEVTTPSPPPNHPTIQTSKIQKNLQSYISSQQWPFWLTPIIYVKGNSILLLYIFWTKNALQSSLSPLPQVLPSAGHVGHDTLWEQQGGSVPVHPTQIQARLQGVKLC